MNRSRRGHRSGGSRAPTEARQGQGHSVGNSQGYGRSDGRQASGNGGGRQPPHNYPGGGSAGSRERDRRGGKPDQRERGGDQSRRDQQKKKPSLSLERRELLGTINARLRQEGDARLAGIQEFHKNAYICPHCNLAIEDISSALTDSQSGAPIHFDCVLNILKEREHCGPDETIAYIGQGKFAVVSVDTGENKHFSIRKTIAWEKSEAPVTWRGEMAGLYSQV